MEKHIRDIFKVHPEAFSDFSTEQLTRIEEREEE
jgi:hypothetical protein